MLHQSFLQAVHQDVRMEHLGKQLAEKLMEAQVPYIFLNAVSLSAGGSRISALLEKLFYSRGEMEDRFPWCKGRPWLLPIAWCVRACRAVSKHGSHILTWSKGTGKVTNEQAVRQKEKLERFGIRRNKK